MNNRDHSFFTFTNGTYRVFCPAKINLYLKVCGKREDGFHELETLFQEIDLRDLLEYEPGNHDLRLTVQGPPLGPINENLVLRAARRFCQETGISVGGRFVLSKQIPAGGGLGGGSSNAAATLKLLNHIHHKPLTEKKLSDLALDLGSDVPFFLKGGCQLGSGRGEVLKPAHAPANLRGGFLIVPPIGLSTGQVFSRWQMNQMEDKKGAVPELGRNDLLEPALAVSSEWAKIWGRIVEILPGQTVFMTGSGSSLVWLTHRQQPVLKLKSLAEEMGIGLLKFAFR